METETMIFRCDVCGGPIRRYDRRNFDWGKNGFPIRHKCRRMKRISGKQMCPTCWKQYIENRIQESVRASS